MTSKIPKMLMIPKPTIETMLAVWREDYEEGAWEHVEDETYDTWRHGSCHAFIAKRMADETYWQVCYRTAPYHDHNDFRDGELGDSDVEQVWPHTVTTVQYLAKPPTTE